MDQEKKTKRVRKPDWLKIRVPSGKEYLKVKDIVSKHKLHTICGSGLCPNMSDCWGRGTATLMILGEICTRSCKFCATKSGKPLEVDYDEPRRVAESVKLMKLKHVVLTSVDRDDLEDGGAQIWEDVIKEIKRVNPDTTIEGLIPDFDGRKDLVYKVSKAGAEVISHNMETGSRLTPQIRSRAKYDISLKTIQYIAESGVTAKSGIMVGLGETEEEIYQVMDDCLAVGCKVFTIGQYLQPTKAHLEVVNYVTPEMFEKYRQVGIEKGFKHIESAPLVRSSFHAEKHV